MKPYYEDNHIRLHNKDCRAMTELNQDRLGRASIIKLLNGIKTILSYLYLARRDGVMAMSFSSLFTLSQFKQHISLFILDLQIWQKALDTSDSLSIGYRPSVEWFAVFRRWLLNSLVAPKMLVEKVNNIRGYLLHTHLLRKDWVTSIASNSHMIGASLNSEIAVTVQTPCQVSLCNFFHSYIIPDHRDGGQVGGDD